MKEFEFELACYALESLDELKFKPFPAKPTVLHELEMQKISHSWKKLRAEERKEITDHAMNQSGVKEYIDRYSKVLSDNLGNSYWLEYYMGIFLKKGDKVFARKVWEVYKGYPNQMENGNATVWKKKEFQSTDTKVDVERPTRVL